MHSILHWIRKEIIKTRWSLCILPIHPCGLGGFYYYLTTFLKTGDAVKLRKRSTQQRTQIRLWMHQFLSHTSYPELLKRLFTGNRCRKRKGNIFVEMFARVGRCFFKFFPEHLEPSIFPRFKIYEILGGVKELSSAERDLNSYWLREKFHTAL